MEVYGQERSIIHSIQNHLESFHIHQMNHIPFNNNLQNNAINNVRPLLTSQDPDMLLATDIE
jgi:hypothetical protein